MPLYTTPLGRYLHKLRLIHNETQSEMSKKLGISSAMLTYIEQGKKRLTDNVFKSLVKKYNLSQFKIDRFNELRKGK